MRMIRLQKQLAHSRIYIPADISPDAWSDTFRNVSADADCLIVNDPGEPKLIVLDMPWIDDADLEDFQRRAPVLALDLGGSGRFRASFLIDTLPYPGGRAHSRHFPPFRSRPLSRSRALKVRRLQYRQHRVGCASSEEPNIFQPAFLFDHLDQKIDGSPHSGMTHSDIPALSPRSSGHRTASHSRATLKTERILVNFGGADPAGLTSRFAAKLGDLLLSLCSGRIIVFDQLDQLDNRRPPLPETWEYISPVESLYDLFQETDLYICHYGISAWEAQRAGVRTIILDVSEYHRKLAELSGFISLPLEQLESCGSAWTRNPNSAFHRTKARRGAGDRSAWNRNTIPSLEARLQSQIQQVQSIVPRSLAEYIASLKPNGSSARSARRACTARRACPACGNRKNNSSVTRNAERSYFCCSECGIIYLLRLIPSEITYGKTYFFEQYRAQYGKTYLEDFDNITALSRQRLRIIRKIQHSRPAAKSGKEHTKPRLLDIGCAYGPFLKAASESGYAPEGIDINAEAVAHVNTALDIPAAQGNIQHETFRNNFSAEYYDVVTMWYVIEHFPELCGIMDWLRHILKPGGILAIATPNSLGISGRKNLPEFLKTAPGDHYSVWNQRQAMNIGRKYGFRIAHLRSVGHHGERFPGMWGGRVLRNFSSTLSRLFFLGDSLEIYFAKEQSGNRMR